MSAQTILKYASISLVAALALGTSAHAVDNAKQLLAGGTSMPQGVDVSGGTARIYAAPGLQNAFGLDFPGMGEGPSAGSIRMPQGGKLSKLRVHVVTTSTPTSGSLTVTIFKNGTATAMKCSVTGEGDCASSKTVTLAAGDRLTVEAKNDFDGSGLLTFTYAMLLD
jgi:hypothetical protein